LLIDHDYLLRLVREELLDLQRVRTSFERHEDPETYATVLETHLLIKSYFNDPSASVLGMPCPFLGLACRRRDRWRQRKRQQAHRPEILRRQGVLGRPTRPTGRLCCLLVPVCSGRGQGASAVGNRDQDRSRVKTARRRWASSALSRSDINECWRRE
jgi:hypothetical protein